MTSDNFVKSQLALLAWREANQLGGVTNMLAVCFMVRNRVNAGWGDWLQCITSYNQFSALDYIPDITPSFPDIREPAFVRLMQAVDSIYDNTSPDLITCSPKLITEFKGRPGLFCAELHNITREWFIEKITSKPVEHPRTSQVTTVQFFG